LDMQMSKLPMISWYDHDDTFFVLGVI
jgi:hypothetical protein